MIQINDNLLQEIGLGSMPEPDKKGLLQHIYETLELRVGMRLADQMTKEQLDEFERYFEAKDDKGAFTWLETNFPNYKDIVQQEFDKLKAEVTQAAPQILNASVQPAQAQQLPVDPNPPLTPPPTTNPGPGTPFGTATYGPPPDGSMPPAAPAPPPPLAQ